MRSLEIQKLIDTVENTYGSITLYGSQEIEQHGTCFMLEGISATFSVLTLEGKLPAGKYDIQIEEQPPNHYIYNLEECVLDDFIQIIEHYKKPIMEWP